MLDYNVFSIIGIMGDKMLSIRGIISGFFRIIGLIISAFATLISVLLIISGVSNNDSTILICGVVLTLLFALCFRKLYVPGRPAPAYEDNYSDMRHKHRPVIKKSYLKGELAELDAEIQEKRELLNVFNREINLIECGLYQPTFEFANSDLYKDELVRLREKQKKYIENDSAAYGNTDWQVNGSKTKGRTMVNNYKKLLLRSFNVECDDIVANVKISNVSRSIDRIIKVSEQISKLGNTMGIGISPKYIQLKIDEVRLALDYQQKKQEEKERIKEIKAQEREEAKILKEIEEERRRLQKEQAHYKNALKVILTQIEKNGESAELIEKRDQLEDKIGDTEKAIENVDYRAANRKAGYVYVISNIGAFGENVFKIGMTRRLDPQERVYELSDASVPFNFDIHAMIFTEDAPGLETALHNAFESRKLNKVNTRREFFAVSLEEIKAEVRKNHDKTVEWVDVPEADQYRQSVLLEEYLDE